MTDRPIETLQVGMFLRSGSPVEVRSASSGRTIGGYAAVFNRSSENLGGFKELVDNRAFAKSRGDGWPGVVARFNHQDNYLLGSTRSGTLRVATDDVGLSYEVDCPECRGDVLEMVQRGDLVHSSFAFQTFEDAWDVDSTGMPRRVLSSVRLLDVAPVTIPAYPDATVGLRSLARHADAAYDEIADLAGRGDLLRLVTRSDRPSESAREGISGRLALAQIEAQRVKSPRERLDELEAKRVKTPRERLAELHAKRLVANG